MHSQNLRCLLSGACLLTAVGFAGSAQAQPLSFARADTPLSLFADDMTQQPQAAPGYAAIPADADETAAPLPADTPQANEQVQPNDDALPENLRRQIVNYRTSEPSGTIVIDTPHAYLYYVLGDGKAIRYGIGVGRKGFAWSGVRTIGRKAEWPDWIPPEEMIKRQPYLPRWVAGGPGNPLGARAMYLAGTEYRIHGTNEPSSIGKHMSSGCIRMLNADVEDLYNRAKIGTKVVVLPDPQRAIVAGRHPTGVMTTASRETTRIN